MTTIVGKLCCVFLTIFLFAGFLPVFLYPTWLEQPVVIGPDIDWRMTNESDKLHFYNEVRELGLINNAYSGPYLLDSDYSDNVAFHIWRLSMYGFAYIYGILTSFTRIYTPTIIPTDAEFTDIMINKWPFRGLLTPVNLSNDVNFEEIIFNATVMGTTIPFEGSYTYATIAKFRRKTSLSYAGKFNGDAANPFKLVSITVNGEEIMPPLCIPYCSNQNTLEAWELAKLYSMMNAYYIVVYSQHPHSHFPMDAFVASLQRLQGSNPILLQLLEQHTEFLHDVNINVILGKLSVLNVGKGTPALLDIITFPREEILKLVAHGSRNEVWGNLYSPGESINDRLIPYYHVIQVFVEKIVQRALSSASNKDWQAIQDWGTTLRIVCGYDLPRDLTNQDVTSIITDYIYRAAVLHSADHYGFSLVDERMMPMVIRIPWNKNIYSLDGIRSIFDAMRNNIWIKMFIPWLTNPLYNNQILNVRYSFESDPILSNEVQLFKQNLKLAEMQVGPELPLAKLARSIEW